MSAPSILTLRQQEIFDFVKDKILNRGYGPTVREIGIQFGIRSPNGVMCHLKALEKKGMILREPHMARAIQLANQSLSRSALASAGRLEGVNPLDVLEKGGQLDFAPLFEKEGNFSVTAQEQVLEDLHIADGDFLVMSRTSSVRNGDVVLAIVDDSTPVLRVYQKVGVLVRLEGSGKTKPIVSKNIEILGKAVAVIRTF